MKLPDPILHRQDDKFWIVRDDLIPGGTKARVLPRLMSGSAQEYVYASPAYGYAQIALAHSARALGKKATVFTAKRKEPHPRTWEAKRAGAKVMMVPHGYLSVVQAKAKAYCSATGAQLLPFGLDTPEFIQGLSEVAASIKVAPNEVWCAAGSGVLARALHMAWPDATICAVQVGCAIKIDKPWLKLYVAPEKFEIDSKLKPPFPSCSNYDAKVWQFMRLYGGNDALMWNVAG